MCVAGARVFFDFWCARAHTFSHASALQVVTPGSAVDAAQERALEAAERTALHLATIYFDLKEFARVGDALHACHSLKARFLRGYAQYLLGEKRREEQMHDTAERALRVVNESVQQLVSELRPLAVAGALDGACLYLLGVALREGGARAAARQALCAAVTAAPLCWCAWLELALLLDDAPDASDALPQLPASVPLASLPLPRHWMRALFGVRALRALQRNVACLRLCAALTSTFPKAAWLRAEHALACYNLREFALAARLFEQQLEDEPNRLDDLVSGAHPPPRRRAHQRRCRTPTPTFCTCKRRRPSSRCWHTARAASIGSGPRRATSSATTTA